MATPMWKFRPGTCTTKRTTNSTPRRFRTERTRRRIQISSSLSTSNRTLAQRQRPIKQETVRSSYTLKQQILKIKKKTYQIEYILKINETLYLKAHSELSLRVFRSSPMPPNFCRVKVVRVPSHASTVSGFLASRGLSWDIRTTMAW